MNDKQQRVQKTILDDVVFPKSYDVGSLFWRYPRLLPVEKLQEKVEDFDFSGEQAWTLLSQARFVLATTQTKAQQIKQAFRIVWERYEELAYAYGQECTGIDKAIERLEFIIAEIKKQCIQQQKRSQPEKKRIYDHINYAIADYKEKIAKARGHRRYLKYQRDDAWRQIDAAIGEYKREIRKLWRYMGEYDADNWRREYREEIERLTGLREEINTVYEERGQQVDDEIRHFEAEVIKLNALRQQHQENADDEFIEEHTAPYRARLATLRDLRKVHATQKRRALEQAAALRECLTDLVTGLDNAHRIARQLDYHIKDYFAGERRQVLDLEQVLWTCKTEAEKLTGFMHERLPASPGAIMGYIEGFEHELDYVLSKTTRLREMVALALMLNESIRNGKESPADNGAELKEMHIARVVNRELALSLELTYDFYRARNGDGESALEMEHRHYVRLSALVMALELWKQQEVENEINMCATQCVEVYKALMD
ncbi:MAG: hypothetical protein JW981_08945 [Anaerolineae bacterium]|nr:hypothetical protein [Anaerolineae bacterium]